MGDYFQFGSVFIKKIIKAGFFKKIETGFKPTSFDLVNLEKKLIWLGFSDLTRFFFGLGLV